MMAIVFASDLPSRIRVRGAEILADIVWGAARDSERAQAEVVPFLLKVGAAYPDTLDRFVREAWAGK